MKSIADQFESAGIVIEDLSASELEEPILCLIPHADDESLGLGALLLECFALGKKVDLILVSDGSQSHPNAANVTAAERRDIREAEFREALHILGSRPDTGIAFWRQPDSGLHKEEVMQWMKHQLQSRMAQGTYATVLTPWRKDPHSDHRAITEVLLKVLAEEKQRRNSPLLMEYLVWLGLQGVEHDFPNPEKTDCRGLLVSSTAQAQKRAALAAHRSQFGTVFDDPTGFEIPESLAQKALESRECYIINYGS